MIVCDKCKLELRPENDGFSGHFTEAPHLSIHLCDDCSNKFNKIFWEFCKNKNV